MKQLNSKVSCCLTKANWLSIMFTLEIWPDVPLFFTLHCLFCYWWIRKQLNDNNFNSGLTIWNAVVDSFEVFHPECDFRGKWPPCKYSLYTGAHQPAALEPHVALLLLCSSSLWLWQNTTWKWMMMVIFIHTAVGLQWFLHRLWIKCLHTEYYLFWQVVILSVNWMTLNWCHCALHQPFTFFLQLMFFF